MSGTTNEPAPREKLRQQIADALDRLLVLHVTTVVGEATVVGADNAGAVSQVTLSVGPQKLANTVVNTALGDSTTIYTPEFVGDASLLAAHKDAVATAHTVRQATIDMLKTVLQDFRDVLDPPRAP